MSSLKGEERPRSVRVGRHSVEPTTRRPARAGETLGPWMWPRSGRTRRGCVVRVFREQCWCLGEPLPWHTEGGYEGVHFSYACPYSRRINSVANFGNMEEPRYLRRRAAIK